MTWHRHIHRVPWWAFRLFAALLILFAVLSSVIQLAVLPWVVRHPEAVSDKLTEMLHRPVKIDRVDARWERTGPLFDLSGVHLGAAQSDAAPPSAIDLQSVGLKINFFAWARRNTSWTEIRLAGIELDLVRDKDGHWQLSGLDSTTTSPAGADDNAVFQLGTVVLRDARLTIHDVPNDTTFKLGADELRLTARGDALRVLGRVRNLEQQSAPVDGVLEYDRSTRSGRVYLGGANVDLAAVMRNYPLAGLIIDRGGGKLQVWAWVKDGEVAEVHAEVDLANLVLTTRTSIALDPKHDFLPNVGIDRLAFGARWQRETDGFNVDVVDLALVRQEQPLAAAQVHLRRRYSGDDPYAPAQQTLSVQAIDLGTVASVAMLVDTLPPDLRNWLYAADPAGTLSEATLRFHDAKDFDVSARMEALSAHPAGKIPGVSALSANVLGDAQAIAVDLPADHAIELSVPKVFREPLALAQFHGSVVAYRSDDAWRIETDALQFSDTTPGKSFAGEARGSADIFDAGGKPSLDLSAAISAAEVPAAKQFWPINVIPAHGVEWLDHALEAGSVVGGRAVFHGNLADWPFRNQAGRFEAVAEVADVRFKYLNDWPLIEHAHAIADFVNAGLHVDADSASIQSSKISKGSVDISDYGEGTLDVSAEAQTSGKDMLAYIKASPLGKKFEDPLQGVDVGGQGKVSFALHAPMNPIEKFQIDGKVQLSDADLSDTKYDLKFDKASGPVRFNRAGFSADALSTTFKSKPAKFSLAVGAYSSDARHVVEATVDTRLPVGDVLAYAPALSDYAKYLSGEANWNAQFSVDHDDAAKTSPGDSGQRLVLTTDLRGVGIDLPAPLNKAAESAVPLKLTLGLPFIGASVDASLGDVMNLRGRLPTPTKAFAANVVFGASAGEPLPKSGIAVSGSAREVDLSGWMSFAADNGTGSGGGNDVLQGVDIRTPALMAWERDLGDARVQLSLGGDALRVAFDGTHIQGTVDVPKKNLLASTISADFKRLYWPEAPDTPPNAPPVGDVRDDSLNPAGIPALKISIDDFHLGNSNYGMATVETRPLPEGMDLQRVDTHSKDIDMKAHGSWTRHNGYHRSTFGIELKAKDFGAMLDALGYGGKLASGEISASIDASWAGPPSMFALNRINGGALHMRVADGRVPNIDPGAGKLAGLLNIAALPRRLAFDFGDLFNKGYSFDSAIGAFNFTDGYAYTDGFVVKSPTADLQIKGAIGLKTSEYNMNVQVTPHIGATVFAGAGAAVGGPVGAAAGALVGTVLGKAINQVTQSEYKVTGPWDNPKMVKVGSRQVAKPDTTPAKPGAGK